MASRLLNVYGLNFSRYNCIVSVDRMKLQTNIINVFWTVFGILYMGFCPLFIQYPGLVKCFSGDFGFHFIAWNHKYITFFRRVLLAGDVDCSMSHILCNTVTRNVIQHWLHLKGVVRLTGKQYKRILMSMWSATSVTACFCT